MQILLNGLVSGLTIAVLALGFSVVFLPTRIFHIALGAIYAATPYVTWAFLQTGWSWYVAVPVAMLVAMGLSLACEWANHALLERKNASTGAHLIASLGVYVALVQVIALVWGNQTKTLRTGLDEVFAFGDMILTRAQGIAAAGSVATLAVFYVWFRFSNLGLQFRALADNPKELALRGYSTRRLRLLAFGVSGLLASVAALLTAYDDGFDPHGGLIALLLAVVAIIVGGRKSFVGPVLGGVLLGVVRSQVVWFLSADWQDAVTFGLLVLFLFVRPSGLIGRKTRLEATGA
jgi:branched-chain amino acid transport system permease protein